jgi:hypothetical protein
VDTLGFQTRQRVHHPAGVFVSVTKQHQPFQMMRRKTANGAINCVFDIRAALIKRTLGRIARYLDLLDLFNLLENGRIGSERNEPRMIGTTGIVGLLNPLHGRLDGRRGNALRDIKEINNRYP